MAFDFQSDRIDTFSVTDQKAPQKDFDPAKEAQKIENLAQARLDTGNSWLHNITDAGAEAAQNLAMEWNSLTPEQRCQVTSQLIKDYQNAYPTTSPVPEAIINDQGQFAGIEFRKSKLDPSYFGPDSIKLQSDGNNIAVTRDYSSAKKGETVDFVTNDIYGVIATLRKLEGS
jgi:hypothetical protein